MTSRPHRGPVQYDEVVNRAVRVGRWIESLHPIVKDGLLAAILTGAMLVDLARQTVPPGAPVRPADTLGFVLVALMLVPLAFRRIHPIGVYVVVLASSVAVATLFYRPTSFGFGLIVATFTVARYCDRRISWLALAIGLAFGVLIKIRVIAVGIDIPWFDWPLDATYFGAAWFLGDAIQTRRRYADELERNRRSLARQAVAEERVRIARELHDAIGHEVSVMVLHAGGGEELLDQDPERARGAFQAIARVGREALADMDRLVGLLRESDEESAGARVRLESLQSLIDGYRDLGMDIRASIEAEPEGIPQAVEQSAYRIIEEALTNAMKHAGPTRVEVSLAYGDGDVHVRVRDHGGTLATRPLGREPHEGRGLVGIRERAALLGGDVVATPHPDGGFLVVANLPYDHREKQ